MTTQESPDDLCTCGHARGEHIYHEGPCRPGFKCEQECEEFVLASMLSQTKPCPICGNIDRFAFHPKSGICSVHCSIIHEERRRVVMLIKAMRYDELHHRTAPGLDMLLRAVEHQPKLNL